MLFCSWLPGARVPGESLVLKIPLSWHTLALNAFLCSDIKLENTLLQMVQGLPLPLLKICDFGYSKAHFMSAPKSKVGRWTAGRVTPASERQTKGAHQAGHRQAVGLHPLPDQLAHISRPCHP